MKHDNDNDKVEYKSKEELIELMKLNCRDEKVKILKMKRRCFRALDE